VIFYGFLALVAVGIAVWLLRSPVLRQARRGHGTDRAEWGTNRNDAISRTFSEGAFNEKKRP
jgi:hypothetical protein